MARITQFELASMQRFQLHDPIDAKIFVHEYDGRRLMQISTYGRDSRQEPGKLSQTIQLDENAAKQLFDLLGKEFGFR
ncbi:methionyl-tRNA formyltransferase [Rhizobium sp. S163]|uniref:methionyl-tRNA formyltransferase n=1 Tax=Rhizobium sp. S163 TaxID=3055039 RepID=UPI0025A9E1E9|nr:methionyl-tRNA formyltransferase [Rhizobium sp. S163]MDM9645203.1 methionyl-tRNA formyltransferase [Rhizobium sp. S163]